MQKKEPTYWIRIVQELGGSLGTTLPSPLIKALSLRQGDHLKISADETRAQIVIERIRLETPIQEENKKS